MSTQGGSQSSIVRWGKGIGRGVEAFEGEGIV